ncbi:hypothetical protein PGT21_005777 [Puccinia graminis f. sp. tritici]|uniref:Uncharacterized protein n=1 Tax=Puccinia graminis f. sp. tritici TaxID=56615 RepID=A0A5B0LUG2_PUCGR|nr:hypothetical protein PGT21_005777 [Puccinia graminis f. sp. tritici]KAA1137767.1 hypothetical protein PGTUg99_015477 [Puccinia graminis f. sp. tritici]
MAELGPVEPVAATIAAFRSIVLNKKSETEYQEIFRKAIRQMFIRALTHKKRTLNSPTLSTPISAPPNEISMTGAGIARNLARVILPALKEKIRLLPAAMNPFLMKSGSSRWFEAILDNLVAIDQLLEEIDSSIIMIWRIWKPDQDEKPSIHHLSYFRGKTITYRTEELLTGPFCTLLIDCDKFFVDFSFSTPSSNNHSISRKWDTVATRTNTSLENIDGLIQCIQMPALAAAKDEWREVADQIDQLIKPLRKQLSPGYNPSMKGDDSESDEDVEALSATGLRLARIGIPLLKMCRLLFNKLSQTSNSQPLIFSGPSMEMDEATLKEVLVLTNEATTLIFEYASELSKSPAIVEV